MNHKARLETLAEAVIPEATEWVKELREYREYQGNDPQALSKAKIGVGVISSAIRLCATIENSRTNDHIEARGKALGHAANPRQITEVRD